MLNLKQFYQSLLENFGQQNWWPAETKEEVVIGAILTQNTNWKNVEKSIEKLKTAGICSFVGLNKANEKEIAKLIRSSGYFNQKAKRLKIVAELVSFDNATMHKPLNELRSHLLDINGIGPETADSILLYAYEKPIFVIDAYTKRILSRLDMISPKAKYSEIQKLFMDDLKKNVELFKQYHALIVEFAKSYCRKKPICKQCFLRPKCNYEGLK